MQLFRLELELLLVLLPAEFVHLVPVVADRFVAEFLRPVGRLVQQRPVGRPVALVVRPEQLPELLRPVEKLGPEQLVVPERQLVVQPGRLLVVRLLELLRPVLELPLVVQRPVPRPGLAVELAVVAELDIEHKPVVVEFVVAELDIVEKPVVEQVVVGTAVGPAVVLGIDNIVVVQCSLCSPWWLLFTIFTRFWLTLWRLCYNKYYMSLIPKPPAKVNYLNNRDILKEIHLSKNTYCWYRDPVADHQFDLILPSVDKINQRTVVEARKNRADRIKRETGEVIDQKKIANTDLVFRITAWEHIPKAPKKITKAEAKRKKLEDIFELEDAVTDDPLADLIDEPVLNMNYVRLNFPPFEHFRLDEGKNPYIVGRSHWKGDLETGEFCRDHGTMTRKLATMFMKLCERYATRSNWRGYTYNEEMRGQALLQLSQIGLQFDESKSQNPFAYYTAAITNSFTRILNIEKKNQNIRDDILEINGLNPSWTRQNSGAKSMAAMSGPVVSSLDDVVQSVDD